MNQDENGPNLPTSPNGFPSIKPKIALERWRGRPENISGLRKPKTKNHSQHCEPCIVSAISRKRIYQALDSPIFTTIKECISSPDFVLQLEGVKTARSLLQCAEMETLLSNSSALINLNIIPECIKFLMSDNTNLLMETTWLLSNISAGNAFSTESLVNAGIIQPMIFLLKSSDPEIVEHSVRTLGNCMAENEEIRTKILNMRVIPHLVDVIKRFRTNTNNMRTLAYALLHASKGHVDTSADYSKPTKFPTVFQMEQILLGVQTLILLNDTDVQLSSCWIVFNITSNNSGGVDAVLRAGLLPKLMFMLSNNKNEEIISPCLKSIANIAEVYSQVDQLVKYGIVASLSPIIKSSNLDFVFVAVYILSNISEGNEDYFKEFLEFEIVEDIVSLIESDISGMAIKRECLFVMKNLAEALKPCISNKLMERVRSTRVMESIVPCLKVKDTSVIDMALTAVNNILALYTRMGKYRFIQRQFEQYGGIEELEFLAYHLNHSISKKSAQILDDHFESGKVSSSSSSSDSWFFDGDSDCDNRDEAENNDYESGVGLYL